MLALLAFFATAQVPSPPTRPIFRDRPIVMAAAPALGDLKSSLLKHFQAVDAMKQGLFNEDISPVVAPYFPVGQPLGETQRIVREQQLGTFKRFKGEADGANSTMYVTHFSLMTETFSNVYVVLDFEYAGSGKDDMILKRMKAFLRASNM